MDLLALVLKVTALYFVLGVASVIFEQDDDDDDHGGTLQPGYIPVR